jgi:CTP:molybdopterin cytidylyltransferase MocA
LIHYVIVRADLPIGMQVAQIVHAAGESTPIRVPVGTHSVALHARDEPHLREVAQRLLRAQIDHHIVLESDGHAMAIGIAPTTDRARVRKVVSSLPLVR